MSLFYSHLWDFIDSSPAGVPGRRIPAYLRDLAPELDSLPLVRCTVARPRRRRFGCLGLAAAGKAARVNGDAWSDLLPANRGGSPSRWRANRRTRTLSCDGNVHCQPACYVQTSKLRTHSRGNHEGPAESDSVLPAVGFFCSWPLLHCPVPTAFALARKIRTPLLLMTRSTQLFLTRYSLLLMTRPTLLTKFVSQLRRVH